MICYSNQLPNSNILRQIFSAAVLLLSRTIDSMQTYLVPFRHVYARVYRDAVETCNDVLLLCMLKTNIIAYVAILTEFSWQRHFDMHQQVYIVQLMDYTATVIIIARSTKKKWKCCFYSITDQKGKKQLPPILTNTATNSLIFSGKRIVLVKSTKLPVTIQ